MSIDAPVPTGRRYPDVGKYKAVAHIATGGMGTVYRAVDTETGREVALKVLAPRLAINPVSLERFRREAARGIRLRHPNIVAIHEFGEASGFYFLALEYVDGIDLDEHITRKGMLAPDEALPLLAQAARALDHLHARQIVHRDVKPSNFLVAEIDGQTVLKLTDFGLAREVREEDFRVTQAGNTVGTIDYMAPEQARDSHQADVRSDIYSLGCTFYHMLAGRAPFAEGGLTERLYKHIEAEPPDVRQVNPAVSDDVLAVLRRMLAKKPADRYQTPAELLDELERLAAKAEGAAAVLPPDRAVEPEGDFLASTTPEQRRAAAGQFERAQEVIRSGNHDYAIHLLKSSCRLDAAHLTYRQLLRRLERTPGNGRRRRGPLAWLARWRTRARLYAAHRRGDHLQVLEYGEELLDRNPGDVGTTALMAEAAESLGLLRLASWLLEDVCRPEAFNPALGRHLARVYEERGLYLRAAGLWERILKADPADAEAHHKIRDLAVKDTLARAKAKESVVRSP